MTGIGTEQALSAARAASGQEVTAAMLVGPPGMFRQAVRVDRGVASASELTVWVLAVGEEQAWLFPSAPGKPKSQVGVAAVDTFERNGFQLLVRRRFATIQLQVLRPGQRSLDLEAKAFPLGPNRWALPVARALGRLASGYFGERPMHS